MKYDILLTDIEEIKTADIIICEDGNMRTVCKNHITTGFMGKCIFGNSYKLGYEKVKKVVNLQF